MGAPLDDDQKAAREIFKGRLGKFIKITAETKTVPEGSSLEPTEKKDKPHDSQSSGKL